MGSILLSIDRIHSSIDIGEESAIPLPPSPLLMAVNTTLGTAITVMGAPLFLDILPLNLASR